MPSNDLFTSSYVLQGITIADANLPDMPIVYVNEAFCRITGYTRDEVVGRNCRFLQGPDTDPSAVDRLRSACNEVQKLKNHMGPSKGTHSTRYVIVLKEGAA